MRSYNSLFSDKKRILSGTERVKAKSLLKNLKQRLKADYKQRDTAIGQEQMSSIEGGYYFPAMHEAHTCISVKTNSTPNQKWIDEIDDAKLEIDFYLNGLLRI